MAFRSHASGLTNQLFRLFLTRCANFRYMHLCHRGWTAAMDLFVTLPAPATRGDEDSTAREKGRAAVTLAELSWKVERARPRPPLGLRC